MQNFCRIQINLDLMFFVEILYLQIPCLDLHSIYTYILCVYMFISCVYTYISCIYININVLCISVYIIMQIFCVFVQNCRFDVYIQILLYSLQSVIQGSLETVTPGVSRDGSVSCADPNVPAKPGKDVTTSAVVSIRAQLQVCYH